MTRAISFLNACCIMERGSTSYLAYFFDNSVVALLPLDFIWVVRESIYMISMDFMDMCTDSPCQFLYFCLF